MNSFFHFRQAIESGQKNTAMLIIRDKTESVARKIIEKAKVSVPDFRGRLFWQWVQNYIISACRANEGENYDRPCNTRDHVCSKPAATVQPQSGSHRYDQAHCSDSDADRPLQHCADARSQTGLLPSGTGSLSAVHTNMGDECPQSAGKTVAPCTPVMDMGPRHAARIYADVLRPCSLVCPEYSLRVCRRHAVTGVLVQVRDIGRACWNSFTGLHDLATHAGKFWSSGVSSGAGSRSCLFSPLICRAFGGRMSGPGFTGSAQWPARAGKQHGECPKICGFANTGSASGGSIDGGSIPTGPVTEIYSRLFFLLRLWWPPGCAMFYPLSALKPH